MKHDGPVPIDIRLMNLAALALGVVAVALLAGTVLAWIVRSPALGIGAVRVVGDVAHNNAATLRANVLPQLSGGFFTLDLARAQRAFETVPWVRRAQVRRQFPNRLRVHLEEHRTVAFWGVASELRMLNSFGEVFEANVGDVDADDLPLLSGPDGQAGEVLATYRALAPVLGRIELVVERLSLGPRGSWSLVTETDAQIELGSGGRDELVQRVEGFVKTLSQVSARYGRSPQALQSADLRHADGYALRLRGVQTTDVKSGKQ